MATELMYPHVEKSPGEPARLQRMPRIRIAQIAMDYLAHGWSAEEMCRQHPNLLAAEVYAAMGYYFDHQAEIDQEIRDEWEQVRQEQHGHQLGGTIGQFVNDLELIATASEPGEWLNLIERLPL